MDFQHQHNLHMDEDTPPLEFTPSQNSYHRNSTYMASDIIQWQASQTSCAALNTLLKEASTPEPIPMLQRDLQQPLAWGSPPNKLLSSGSSKSTSTPASSSGAKPRTRLRSRRQSELQTSTSLDQHDSGSPSAMLSLQKDPQKLLDLVKNASTRMDAKARRRPTTVSSRGVITRRNSTMAVTSMRNNKGKGKEVLLEGLEQRNGKMPTVKRLKRNDSSSTSSSSMWIDCDNDSASPSSVHMDASMDVGTSLQLMDVDEESLKDPEFDSAHHYSGPPLPRTRTHMLPPPIPKSKSSSPTNPLASNSASGHASRLVANSIRERTSPEIRPLVKQERQKDPTPSISHPVVVSRPPPPLAAPPRPSQPSKHPPLLGMRGALTRASSSPFAPSQTLPARQKGFKPPLLSQSTSVFRASQQVSAKPPPPPPPPPPKSIAQPGHAPSDGREDDDEADSRQSKSRSKSRSSSPPAGADSSFEYNVSFEIDPDALEETLQKYD